MTIIEAIKDYIEDLDCIKIFDSAINVNFLNSETDSFSIEELPANPILKKYIDGSTKRQFNFAFCSREPYGIEILQNIENSNFYEKFANEIENNDKQRILPLLDNDLESLNLEIMSSAYVVSTENDTGMYQINLNFKYLKKRG